MAGAAAGGTGGRAVSDPNVDGFEATLRDRPDDLAAWSAYADYLAERGDPRGEFMRVQLALEDESLAREERDALKRREHELLAAHRRAWMGPTLYDSCYHQNGRPREGAGTVTFRRGWVWDVDGSLWEWTEAELAAATELRWVQRLRLDSVEADTLTVLARAPFAPVLRAFEYGGEEDHSGGSAAGLEDLLAALPRLEKLWVATVDVDAERLFAASLPTVTELAVHCLRHYPTDILAANPTLARLRSIEFRPHGWYEGSGDEPYLTAANVAHLARSPHLPGLARLRLNCCNAGNEAVSILASSGLLFRLESLDLSDGAITDAGAVALARTLRKTPHKLKRLRLENNALTATGVAALRAAGLAVEAPRQHRPGDTTYLYHGDME